MTSVRTLLHFMEELLQPCYTKLLCGAEVAKKYLYRYFKWRRRRRTVPGYRRMAAALCLRMILFFKSNTPSVIWYSVKNIPIPATQ
jgi:hypothetical protein